jgi:midasin (ATPase involved in ribosome maturation)
VVGLQALLKYEQKAINIYEEYHPAVVEALVQPLPAVMEQIHDLLARYPIDNIKNLATICGKIQERSLFDEIYKILIDCEFLVEKIFEINAILPLASHIATDRLVQNCLRVRRLELANWRQMMDLKIRRTEKSDMVEFVDLFKNVRDIRNEHELFALCERFLRESKLSCLPSRIRLLLFLEERGLIAAGPAYGHVLHRVIGFFEYLLPEVRRTGEAGRKAKETEMREYEKLAGWSSNEYLIFKATCEKFQRKIHHILRRYDEELSLTVGTFHQQLLEKQIFPTVKEFADGLAAILDINPPAEVVEE